MSAKMVALICLMAFTACKFPWSRRSKTKTGGSSDSASAVCGSFTNFEKLKTAAETRLSKFVKLQDWDVTYHFVDRSEASDKVRKSMLATATAENKDALMSRGILLQKYPWTKGFYGTFDKTWRHKRFSRIHELNAYQLALSDEPGICGPVMACLDTSHALLAFDLNFLHQMVVKNSKQQALEAFSFALGRSLAQIVDQVVFYREGKFTNKKDAEAAAAARNPLQVNLMVDAIGMISAGLNPKKVVELSPLISREDDLHQRLKCWSKFQ